MLGDIVGAVVEAVLEGLIPEPQTDRGHLSVLLCLSTVALIAEGWTIYRVTDPLHGPQWAFGVMLFGMFLSLPGLAFGLVHLFRGDGNRLLTAATLLVSSAAFGWPYAAIVLR